MISFLEAAIELERLCDKVDSIDEITPVIEKIFSAATSDLSESVDRRISFIKYAESQIESGKTMRDQWDARIKRFERILNDIKHQTTEVMKSSPNLPYKGQLGSLKVQKNSVPSLVFENADHFMRQYFYSVYVDHVPKINNAEVKKYLQAGEILEGTKLEYGEHLRISIN